MLIPARLGPKPYTSVERKPLLAVDGQVLGETTITPPLLLRDRLRKETTPLRELPLRELVAILARAGELFVNGKPDGLTAEEYVRICSLGSGLPAHVIDRTMRELGHEMQNITEVLTVQTPDADLELFDRGYYTKGSTRVAVAPRGRNLAVNLPANHPGPNQLWLPAVAMKYSIVLRPSLNEVFTPNRLTTALLEAGLPPSAIVFAPGERGLIDALIEGASFVALFGGQQAIDQHGANRRVKVYGPGRSKVVVEKGVDLEEAATLVARLILDDGGRGCINCSAVAVEGDARPLAEAVAAKLRDVPLLSVLDPNARLAAFRNEAEAKAYDDFLRARLVDGAEDLSVRAGESRYGMAAGATILRPTVVMAPSLTHPLYGVELPFPFAVFASVETAADLLPAARSSLAVVHIGAGDAILDGLVREPSIQKVYAGGALSTHMDPREAHEGFIFDFLFEKKAYRPKIAIPVF